MKKALCTALACLLALGLFAGCNKDESAVAAGGSISSAQVDLRPTNPLTGLRVDDDYAATHRPVGVMINNLKAALPQYGLAQADILYEVVAEGGITRLLAIYSDARQVPKIGSVRSARPVYIELATGHDATLIHYGTSTQADALLQKNGIKTVDGMALSTVAFSFDEVRHKTYSREHCTFTSGELIQKGLDKKSISLSGAPRCGFSFCEQSKFSGELYAPSYGKADEVSFPFSGYVSDTLRYNAATYRYEKYQFGQPHIDAATGETLSFDNALLLYTSIRVVDQIGHVDVDLDSGTGYYFTRGQYEPIRWKKGGVSDPLTFTKEDGSPLTLNAGKTYVAVVSDKNESSLDIAPGKTEEPEATSSGASSAAE